MGGLGSGPRSRRTTVEMAMRVDVPTLKRQGYLRGGGRKSGSWSWVRAGQLIGKVEPSTRLDPEGLSELVLSYTVAGRASTQRIRLEALPMRFGGWRWYFVCPSTSRRCAVLVMPVGGDRFASVKAWGLAYQCQREDAFQRAHRRIAKAERRLDVLSRYARHPTREKLWRRVERAEAVLDYGVAAMAAAFLGKPFVSRSEAARARERDLIEED